MGSGCHFTSPCNEYRIFGSLLSFFSSQTVFAWMFKPKRRGGLQAASAPSSCCSSTASAHPASHSPTAACPDSGMMANESQVAEAIIAQLVCSPPFPEAALSTVQPCSSDEGERANTGSDNSAAGLNPPTHEPTLKNWQVPYVT